jgi:hypothetical protein
VPRRIWTVAIACVLALAAGACGDDERAAPSEPEAEAEGETGLSEEERELAEREEAAGELPAADRLAYYQLATGSGLLRGRALAARRGGPPPPDSDDRALEAAAKRIKALRPRDRGLRRLRGRLIAALDDARGVDDTAGARRLLERSDAVNRGLHRYGHREPLIAVFLPD